MISTGTRAIATYGSANKADMINPYAELMKAPSHTPIDVLRKLSPSLSKLTAK